MDIRTPTFRKALVQAHALNLLPWSVFMTSGAPCRVISFVSASAQGSVSIVFDSRYATTLRVAKSIMTVR